MSVGAIFATKRIKTGLRLFRWYLLFLGSQKYYGGVKIHKFATKLSCHLDDFHISIVTQVTPTPRHSQFALYKHQSSHNKCE